MRSRGTSKSQAASLNLRPMEGGEKPPAVRIKLPKATNAMVTRTVPAVGSPRHDDLMHPRRALDIARSYGVPKYFLRGNSQILTDGRMRLFADNVWKKERTSPPQDAEQAGSKGIDNSDVICRLMDSVDKAIATSERPDPDGGILADSDVAGRTGGTISDREKSMLRESIVSLPDVLSRVSVKEIKVEASQRDDGRGKSGPVIDASAYTEPGDSGATSQTVEGRGQGDIRSSEARAALDAPAGITGEEDDEVLIPASSGAIRPHTVDTVDTFSVPRHLPRVPTFREPSGTAFNTHWTSGIPEHKSLDDNNNFSPAGAQFISQQKKDNASREMALSLSSQMSGIRLRQMRGASESLASNQNSLSANNINNRVGVLFGGKYRNVLPRFYPAVSAHHVRQREAAARLGGVGVRLYTTATGKKRGITGDPSSQHLPRRLVRFADTTHTVRFSRDAAVAATSTSASLSPRRTSRDNMTNSGVLVASRAPVQSIQRSLDSHSGLSRNEWFRCGRGSRGVVSGQRALVLSTATKSGAAPDLAPITSPPPKTTIPITAVEAAARVEAASEVDNKDSPRKELPTLEPEPTVHMFDLESSVVSQG